MRLPYPYVFAATSLPSFVQRNHPIHERRHDSDVLVRVPSLKRREKASAAGEVSRNVRQERERASSHTLDDMQKTHTLLSKLRGQQALRNCSTLTSLAINNSVQPQDVAVADASYTREKLASKCAPKGFHCPLKGFPHLHRARFLSFGNCQSKNKKRSPQGPNSSTVGLNGSRRP